MKISLLSLLFLSLPVAAQYRPMYSTSRPGYTPSYTPRPTTSSTSNYNYQRQSAQLQQAHQNFQQMQAQQRQQMQQHYYNQQRYYSQQQHLLRYPQSPQQLEQALARQQQAEQKATEQLTQLTAEQQRQHQAHPAANAQQAAAEQQADARQLARLSLKNYREVFLPGQLRGALQSLTLAPPARQQLQAINHDLLDNAWWSQQDASQLPAKVANYGTAITKLTTNLLGFGPATVPTASPTRPASALQQQLSQGPAFDPAAATQLIGEAAQAEKRLAGARLAQAVQDFSAVSSKVAANPVATSQAQKQQRNEVKKSLKRVNKELLRYDARVGSAGPLSQTQAAIMESSAAYLSKSNK